MKTKIKNQYEYSILSPGGNIQMLIKGIPPKQKRRFVNNEMIKRFPFVEQVSFYEYNSKTKISNLELSGGEFCGNATRSLAYLLLKGKKGQIKVRVSGTTQMLKAGVKEKSKAYAQMPIQKDQTIQQLRKGLFRIDLEGITQLVCLDYVSGIKPEKLKSIAFEILKKKNLIYSVPAAGVMFIEEKNKLIQLKPIVWVRDIKTILYETACATGTAAVGLWKASQTSKKATKIKVLQPSGKFIEAQVNKNPFKVLIDGPVEILGKGSLKL